MRRKKIRWQWLSAAIISLLMFCAPALAGDLNPSAPPASTMRPMSEVSQPWDQVLPASERFKLVLGATAVLDKETGLVWERSPGGSPTLMNWYDASAYCYNVQWNGRKGWRLPTVEELASLVDPSRTNPALPSGHPFLNVQLAYYWSATTSADDTAGAWVVNFGGGGVVRGYSKTFPDYVWCVRGGQGPDTQ